MKKRILSVFLIVCLCAALLPTFAAADTSAIQGSGTEADPWILTQKVFDNPGTGSPVEKVNRNDGPGTSTPTYNLMEGCYKLGGDVAIGKGEIIRIIHKVTLDLNGYGIKKAGEDAPITIQTDTSHSGNLTLKDSQGGGTISNRISVPRGTFTMYGGSILGDVTVANGSTFKMMGGDCKGKIQNKGGTITGVFYSDVQIEGEITGGVFYGDVTNVKVASDSSKLAKITGGVFYGNVQNEGEITGGVFFGEIKGNRPASLHTVTFSTGEAEPFATACVVGNSQKLAPPKNEPTKDGFKFTGWYDGETEWDFETIVSEDLTLTAGWEEIPDENPDEQPDENPDEQPDENPDGVGGLVAILDDVPFVDVDFNDYYYDSVKWAYHSGVTGGTDAWHFSPDAGCTRAQAVTFLWRAAGCPTASYLGNFTDVDADAYYAPAVAWAVANGVTNGTSATTFSPDAACSRGDIVTFLYRAFGGVSNGYHPFGDVAANAYYADAVAWAYEHGVTGGTSSTTFSPADACSRAQIVTFLYRVLG